MWCHGTWSTLVHAMVCWMMAPCRYSHQVDWILMGFCGILLRTNLKGTDKIAKECLNIKHFELEFELELEKCSLDKIAHTMYKANSQYECQIHCTNCQEILILVKKETAVIRTTREKTGQYIMPCYQLSIPWKYHQIVINRHSYLV